MLFKSDFNRLEMFCSVSCRCVVLFILLWCAANSLRIPENPCPATFNYYKKSGNGEIYGEAVIPYDRSNNLRFSVNASLVGYFDKAVSTQYNCSYFYRECLKNTGTTLGSW